MSLGQILLEKKLVDHSQLHEAAKRQQLVGGSWLESALALGFVAQTEVDAALREPPTVPGSVDETGLDLQFVLDLLLKSMYVLGLETRVQAAESLKLPQGIVELLLQRAKSKRLVEARGTSEDPAVLRYALSGEGAQWASGALQKCQYTGPAPVPLQEYRVRVLRQSVAHENVTAADLARQCSHLVLEPGILERLGPAINSGKAILLYGAGGNGKTSIAESIGYALRQEIYVPYCVEVDRQIVKIFDPALHEPVDEADSEGQADPRFDPRWVHCRRPVVLTGGELTMELLDLNFDPVYKYYEAPAHVKATGGVFIIDDFGRQRVRPADLVNRWLLPLERGVDYLTLHTGKKLEIDFDEIVVFSTNFPPQELMDGPALRRINYKLHVAAPSAERYTEILRRVCSARGLELRDDVLSFLLQTTSRGMQLACYQPKAIVEHVVARCTFDETEAALTVERVREALQNLALEETNPST